MLPADIKKAMSFFFQPQILELMTNLKCMARIAGLGYLIIFITGFFANFFVIENIVFRGDAQRTAEAIVSQPNLFVWAIAAFMLMITVDILLAGPLYLMLKKTHQRLSEWMALLRIANGIVFLLAVAELLQIAFAIEEGAEALAQNVMVHFALFEYTWQIGLLIFGVHLFTLGALLIKSARFPAWIGFFVLAAGMGYTVDCTAFLFYDNYAAFAEVFADIVLLPAILGEFSFTLFLLIKGIRKNAHAATLHSPAQTSSYVSHS
jgi:hypothetical protein